MTPNQALEVMQQVDHFYNNAWQQLVWFGTSLAAIFGLLIPLFTYLYQKRLVQAEEKQLLSKINELVAQAKQDMRQEVLNTIAEGFKAQKATLDATIADLKKEVEKQKQAIDQGLGQAKQETSKLETKAASGLGFTLMIFAAQSGNSQSAFSFGIKTLNSLLETRLNQGVRAVTEVLIDKILPTLNRKMIEDAKLEGNDLAAVIEKMEKLDHDGIWSDLVPKLKRAFAAAQGR